MTQSTPHWTANSASDFAYSIAADFAAQIELKLESLGISRSAYAERLGVGKSRVSKLLNDPGNLGVESMVECAHAVGMKVAILAYDDHDPDNNNGPIGGQVFDTCWKRAGKPRDMFEVGSGLFSNMNIAASQDDTIKFLRPCELPQPVRREHWEQENGNVIAAKKPPAPDPMLIYYRDARFAEFANV